MFKCHIQKCANIKNWCREPMFSSCLFLPSEFVWLTHKFYSYHCYAPIAIFFTSYLITIITHNLNLDANGTNKDMYSWPHNIPPNNMNYRDNNSLSFYSYLFGIFCHSPLLKTTWTALNVVNKLNYHYFRTKQTK